MNINNFMTTEPLMRFDQDRQVDLFQQLKEGKITMAEHQELMMFHCSFVKSEMQKQLRGESLTNIDDLREALGFLLRLKTHDEKDKADIQEMAYNVRSQIDELQRNYYYNK